MSELRIALVHDWMVSPGGAERVLYELHRIWPKAPIFTAAYVPEKFPEFAHADVRPTWLDKISLAKKKHQFFPILRGWAFKSLDLSGYDVVISSCSAESKYVRTGPKTLHICYCHTPIRYYWSDYDWYMKHPPFGRLNWLAKIVLRFGLGYLRRVDLAGAAGVDVFVANSKNVEARVKKYYQRNSIVIYPPIITTDFERARNPKDYYVVLGRQVAYKRLDLVVDAFNELGWPLKVAGTGEELKRQQPRAQPNIEFLGRVSDDARAKLLSEAKGFVFPPEEDFGMAAVEAMAAGCPVVAYAKGGALEFMEPDVTGVLFYKQTTEVLVKALREFDELTFDEKLIRQHARLFDSAMFRKKIVEMVDKKWAYFNSK